MRTCVRLKHRDYIVLDGFDMTPEQPQLWVQMEACKGCCVRNCRMQYGGGSYQPAYVLDCHYCRFERLDVSRAVQLDTNGHVGGNMFGLYASSHNVIEDCRFGKAGHDPSSSGSTRRTTSCAAAPSAACGGGTSSSSPLLTRSSRAASSPTPTMAAARLTAAQALHLGGIFRRNLIYRNWYQPLTISAYKYEQMEAFGLVNSRLYHNTFYRNYESGFEMFDMGQQPAPHMVRGNVLQNNLFAYNDPGGDGLALNLGGNIATDNCFRHNLFYGEPVAAVPGGAAYRQPYRRYPAPRGAPEGRMHDTAVRAAPPHPFPATCAPRIKYVWPSPLPDRPNSQLRTAAQADAQLPGQFTGNLDGEPRFVNAEKDDYRLAQGSPAIDAGEPLTVAREAGQGKLLPVADARCFYDGFGIPGEAGDLVFVGPGKQVARVLKSDVDQQTLELDRALAWHKGDGVTLPYTGKAPDIGAYEARAEKEAWYLARHPRRACACRRWRPRPAPSRSRASSQPTSRTGSSTGTPTASATPRRV